jgi:hypothetical protein
LREEEKNMQIALTVVGKKPLSKVPMKIVEHLRVAGKRTMKELLVQFWEQTQTGKVGLEEVINYLQTTDQIKAVTEDDRESGRQTIYYMVKE